VGEKIYRIKMVVILLPVSSKNTDRHCSSAVNAMQKLGVCGDVTANTSVVNGKIEKRCRISKAFQ
jgi:hypothetical protein